MWSLTTWGGGRVFSLISNALIIHDHTTKGVITVKDTILLSDLTGHRWRDICFDRQPFMFQSVLFISIARARKTRKTCDLCVRCYFKVFRYSFSEAIPIFFNRFKSDFILVWSLYNFHQWLNIDWNLSKRGFSKIDITMTTINKNSNMQNFSLLTEIFCWTPNFKFLVLDFQ